MEGCWKTLESTFAPLTIASTLKKTPSCVKRALAPRALQKKQKLVERWPQKPCLRLTCGDRDVPITDYSFSWLHKVETCCLCTSNSYWFAQANQGRGLVGFFFFLLLDGKMSFYFLSRIYQLQKLFSLMQYLIFALPGSSKHSVFAWNHRPQTQ